MSLPTSGPAFPLAFCGMMPGKIDVHLLTERSVEEFCHTNHVRILGCYMRGSCLEEQVVVLRCRHCKGSSHSSFLASLAMEFVVSGKDEIQSQENNCFVVKPCHPPRTLQWAAAALEGGVFAALLAASQCEPLVSKEVIKAIAGSLHGCLRHHEQPPGPVQAGFPCCAFPCGSHLSSGVAVTLILIVGTPHEPGSCCLFSLLPCLPHQNRAGNRHCLSHCGL